MLNGVGPRGPARVLLAAVSLVSGASISHAGTPIPVASLEVRHLKQIRIGPNDKGKYRFQMTPSKSGGRGDYEFRDARSGSKVPAKTVFKNSPLVLTGRDLKRQSVAPARGNGSQELTLELTDAGRARFRQFTSNNVGAILAIVLDGKLVSAPMVNAPVTDGKLVIPY